MKTNVTVTVSVVIPISYNEEAPICYNKESTASFVEKIAKDAISDILNNSNSLIDIQNINACSKGLRQG